MQVSLFDKYQTQTPSKATERGELLKDMMEVINLTRSMSGIYKPLTMARMGMLVAHIPVEDLYYLKSVCTDSGNRAPHFATGFSKRFFFEIKPQK